MSSFRCLYIESDNPKLAMELAGALIAGQVPQELPAPAAAEPVKAIEHHEAPTALPEPVRVVKTRHKRKPRQGPAGGSKKDQAIAWVRENGPARQADILRGIGAPRGSGGSIFKDPVFVYDDEQLIHLAGGKKKAAPPPKPRKTKPKPAVAAGTHGELRTSRIDASIEYLRKHGPSRKSHVAKAIGISAAYATGLYRDTERIMELKTGLIWIAGEPVPAQEEEEDGDDEEDDEEPDEPTDPVDEFEEPPVPKDLSTSAKRTEPPTVDELTKAIKSCGPMDLKEFARFTECSEANCFRVLQDPAFEKIDGLYWVAK